MFGASRLDTVAVGNFGFLFYGETLDNNRGAKTLTDRQIHSINKVVSLMKEYVEDRGAKFYFTIAPNKVSLYPMWAKNAKQENKSQNIERLKTYLQKDSSYIDLFDEFRKKSEVLYYAKDSHWTNKGTALAHDIINTSKTKTNK